MPVQTTATPCRMCGQLWSACKRPDCVQLDEFWQGVWRKNAAKTDGERVSELLGQEALCTLRLALRQAARADKIGNRPSFKILYRRLGGQADLDAECSEVPR